MVTEIAEVDRSKGCEKSWLFNREFGEKSDFSLLLNFMWIKFEYPDTFIVWLKLLSFVTKSNALVSEIVEEKNRPYLLGSYDK